MSSSSHSPADGVAIIAMNGRFPGARDLDQFWRRLAQGVESITQLSDEDLRLAGVSPVQSEAPGFVRAASVLEDVDLFDAPFFGFSPREAEIMDPQQRVFLECAWAALEAAGYRPGSFPGRIGVYAGARISDYLLFHVPSHPEAAAALGSLQTLISNDKDYLATLTSYKLDLRGPSVSVQTACSTSLVAIHLACEALLSSECDLALAGGISIRLSHNAGYVYTEGGIASPDGHCRAFDARAAGTVFGNGVGIVVLKRLEDALADGDPIRAVIRGSAINNDGAQKVGFTAPSVVGQATVISEALEMAGVDPESISYIEAHGTGTPMGDPIEVEALTRVFRRHTRKQGFCALGSVKTNIGHLETAAGIAGLIKVVLALENGLIPPSLHFEEPNPRIDFARSPFHVNASPNPWRSGDGPRRAGVSSFGIGGTNAHVVLEEAPAVRSSGPSRSWQLLTLSARTASALESSIANLEAHLEKNPAISLADVAFTLRAGRAPFQHRAFAVVRDLEDAQAALAPGSGPIPRGANPVEDRPLVFLFPGQGSQHVDMAGDLYREEPVFRQEVDRCCDLLRPHLGIDLREVLYPGPGGAEQAAERLRRTELAQPALFVVEHALARLWMEWGIRPWAMIGHSIGEYVAACLAGVFRLQDALALVAVRGRLSQSAPAGSMLGVPLGEEDLRPLLGERLSIAAFNSPSLSVVSGPADAAEDLRARLASLGVDCRPLHTSHAFHSELMEPVLEAFERHLRGTPMRPPQLPFISNVTGTWISEAEATDPAYWVRHLRQPVRFAAGISELLRQRDAIFLEAGPGRTLTTLAQRNAMEGAQAPMVSSLPHPEEEVSDVCTVLSALGRLWLAGLEPDIRKFYERERRNRVALPTYPFERQRYWIERARGKAASRGDSPRRKPDLDEWFYLPYWKPSLPPSPRPLAGGGRWLLFVDGKGFGRRLAERLRRDHQEVVTVVPGTSFEREGRSSYALDPQDRESYRALLSDLRSHGGVPGRILHLWGVGERVPGLSEEEHALRAAHLGFFSLVSLVQALGEEGAADPIRLVVVTSQAHRIGEDDVCLPERAGVLGPCRVIPQEYPHLTCRSVDIPAMPAGGWAEENLVEALIAEAESDAKDAVVGYRGRQRWIEGFEPVLIPPASEGRSRLRRRGVYLITGGLGGIGLELAEHLVRSVEARLILAGRTPPPPRSEWSARLPELAPEDPLRRKLERIEALESMGAEILVGSGDISDPAHVRDLLDQALERFGELHGVFHLAGVAGLGILQRKSAADMEAVLRPKVQGTLALAQGLRGRSLDFLVLASSTIALLGGAGQADYAAANSFLDAFAGEHARSTGIPTVAVAWPGWADLGMRRNSPGRSASARAEAVSHPLLTRLFAEPEARSVFEAELDPAEHWILSEHRVLGRPVLPGTALLELALAAFLRLAGRGGAELSEVAFLSPADVAEGGRLLVQVLLDPEENGFRFRIRSRLAGADRGEWRDHATGRAAKHSGSPPRRYEIGDLLGRCNEVQHPRSISASGNEGFVTWGSRWQSLRTVHLGSHEAVARLELPVETAREAADFELHPALLDVATSFGLPWIGSGHYLPLSYQRLRVNGSLPEKVYSHVRFGDAAGGVEPEVACFDVTLLDEAGSVLVEIEQMSLRRVSMAQLPRAVEPAVQADGSAGASQGISSREGIEALDRILASSLPPRIVISPRSFDALRAAAGKPISAEREARRTSYGRPEIATSYVAPRNQIEQAIAEMWQRSLGIERVGVHDSFFELGGHSLLALRLISEMRETFGIDLPVAQIFNSPTVASLAAAIVDKLSTDLGAGELDLALAELEQLSEGEVQALLGDSVPMEERRLDG